ncbi:expressed unknown protein [Seminavis robusta]|uniref:Uncharacterized protein n=1 Tax=Seminavis robusta TaxID=568900 RepID=A0A9N8HLG6_9STRA|nr:expressed unknown protein [Seminavis robusta]|eukprot:Sro914_g219590.1 n/a (115) ;mRNA; f:23663-24007
MFLKDNSMNSSSKRSQSSSVRSSTGSMRSSKTQGEAVAARMQQMNSHDMIAMLEMYAQQDNGEVAFEAFQTLKNSESPATTPSSSSKSSRKSDKKRLMQGKRPVWPAFGRTHTS